MLAQSLLDASRLVETDLFVPVDYFAAATETSSTKKFYHNGTKYVRLKPYVEFLTIQDSDENYVDDDEYILNEDFDPYTPSNYYLKWGMRTCGRWWGYSPITVTARWGFPCIPPDIVMAVRSMASVMFLSNPMARVGLNQEGLSSNQEQRLRGTYTRVMRTWSDKLHHVRNLGIG